MNYTIAIVIIFIFLIPQLWSFVSTWIKTSRYKSIFANSKDEYLYSSTNGGISTSHKSKDLLAKLDSIIKPKQQNKGILNTIIVSINNYLLKNIDNIIKRQQQNKDTLNTIIVSINNYLLKNTNAVSDFHLIKDIVDRNVDADEEEIYSQIPFPIFLGLMGTMIGIIVGIVSLIATGGLDALFTISKDANDTATNTGLEGVKGLLGGVGVAMITSIFGILFNTISSHYFKNSKSVVEKNKNTFLSWIQAELLPNLSNNVSGALVKMSTNLQKFNTEFSKNTTDFQTVLLTVNKATDNVSKSLTAIQSLKMTDIASANISVYEKLKNCTDEIGKLGDYLNEINQYQANTDNAIEEMRKNFSNANVLIDSINGKVREALEAFGTQTEEYLKNLQVKLDGQIGTVNEATTKQQEAFQKHFDELFGALTSAIQLQNDALLEHFAKVSENMQTAANEQQEIFKAKFKETTALVDELKNLSAVKNSMAELVKQTSTQSQQIAQLTKAIKELAEMKSSGVVRITRSKQEKIMFAVGGTIAGGTCLAVLIPKIIELIKLIF